MKKVLSIVAVAALSAAFVSCGPSKEEIEALAKLPNREGMLSMLLSVLQAPVRNFALAIKAVSEKDGAAA